MDDVCLIVESDGKYLTSGIPSDAYDLIAALEHVQFAVVIVAHRPYAVNAVVAKLPSNVKTLVNVILDEEFLLPVKCPLQKQRVEFYTQLAALYESPLEEKIRYCEPVFLGLARDDSRVQSYEDIVKAPEFWNILCSQYERYCPQIPFLDYVWIFRQTQLPFFQLMQTGLPEAKIYHVFSSRYGGCAGLAAKIQHRSHLIFDVREDFFITDRQSLSAAALPFPMASAHALQAVSLDVFIKTYNATLKTIRYLTGFYADTIITASRSQDAPLFGQDIEYKHLVIPSGFKEIVENADKGNLKEKISIGFIGDITPESDVKSFIRAGRILLDEMKQVGFSVLGLEIIEPAYLEECIVLKNGLGLEMDMGISQSRDVNSLFIGLDLIVFSGVIRNQVKIILCQALKSGKPIVAVRHGIYPDIIQGHSPEDQALGECGILVESGSPQELARAIYVILKDKKLAKEMGKIALRRFEQFYSHSIHINSYVSLYKNYF
jgi:glycosyltransferase involved in cell wall biosynthesis